MLLGEGAAPPGLTRQAGRRIFPSVESDSYSGRRPADLLGKASLIHAAIRDGSPHEPSDDLLGSKDAAVPPSEQVVSRPVRRRRKVEA